MMDLRETILEEHSKVQTNKIVKWVGSDQKRFNELFWLFLHDDDPVVIQRAAWPLSYCALDHPELIQKHFGKLIKNLHKPKLHDAVKRNTMRILEDITIPVKLHGEVMDICFDYITDPGEKPAIKAFSLTVLQNLSRQYPDIRNEIKVIIEERWEHEGAAFRSRAKKILKEIS
ncbi:MAG TPA: hypothetical protein VIZ28_17620 [Chitinophagaceae bacterium]